MHFRSLLEKRYSQRHSPGPPSRKVVANVRKPYQSSTPCSPYGMTDPDLSALEYSPGPKEHVSHVQLSSHVQSYLVKFELCDDDLRGIDREGNGLT